MDLLNHQRVSSPPSVLFLILPPHSWLKKARVVFAHEFQIPKHVVLLLLNTFAMSM